MKSIWILVVVSALVAGSLMTGTMASAQSSDFNVDSFFDVFFEIDVSSQQCPNPNEIPKINPDLNGIDCSSDFVVDSFFDIFYDNEETSKLLGKIFGDPDFDRLFGDPDFDTIGSLQETDEGSQFQIDSFFDVFFDVSADGDRNTIEPLVQLFGDPDFLFGDPDFQVDSFFDIFVEIDARDRHFDTEIVAMDLRVSSLEDSPPSASAVDMYIKIGDIKGESTDDKHKEWIIIESFSHSMSPSVGAERSRGGVTFGDIVVVKELDKSTPKIGEAVTKGGHFPEVKIDLVRTFSDGTRATYYAYELTNVLITSYSIGGSGEVGSTPTEQVSLNFEKAKVTYTEFDNDGTEKGKVEATWKVEKGEK